MAFWTDKTTYEPLRQHRWFIDFGNDKVDNFRYALKDCKKPSFKIDTTQHVLLNDTYNFPKNLVWQPIDFTFVSVRGEQGEDLARFLLKNVNRSGYRYPDIFDQEGFSALNGYSLSKSALNQEMFGFVNIVQVDANGFEIESWRLYNVVLTAMDFGNLTYENEAFVDIKVSISYDYAKILKFPLQKQKTENDVNVAKTSYKSPTSIEKETLGKPGFPGPKTEKTAAQNVSRSSASNEIPTNRINQLAPPPTKK